MYFKGAEILAACFKKLFIHLFICLLIYSGENEDESFVFFRMALFSSERSNAAEMLSSAYLSLAFNTEKMDS